MTTFADGESGLSVRTKINDVLQHMDGTAGTLVVNEAGADVDFRVESDTVINALFVDGATGNVGLGTGTPTTRLYVTGGAVNATFDVAAGDTRMEFRNAGTRAGYIYWDATENRFFSDSGRFTSFYTGTAERMRITETGNVGIGTIAPSAKLQLANAGSFGAIRSTNTTDSVQFDLLTTSSTVALGASTAHPLVFNTSNTERIRITAAGITLIGTTTASGANLLQVTGDALVNGYTVGRGGGNVAGNLAVGLNALAAHNAGVFGVTAIGEGALQTNTTGASNTAVGSGALLLNSTGASNVAVGTNALRNNSTAANNSAVGQGALQVNTTGANNTAVGYAALNSNTTSAGNTAVGTQALVGSTGPANTAVGHNSLLGTTTGSYNIGIGGGAGSALTTGSNNTIIGSVAGTAGLANTIILGAGTTERLRIDSNGNMSIGDAPVAWSASYKAFNIASSFSSIASNGANRIQMGANNYFDGTNYIYGASSFATRYEQVLGVHSWHNAPSGTAAGTITFTQAMTLDNSGNLGVGITAPGHKLHVASAGNNYIASHNTAGSTSALLLGAESGSTNIYSWTTAAGATGVPLRFTVGASESMRIDTAGNLGVGTISPNAASIIDAQSTTKGVRFPNMTTTQKNAIANVAGNVIFDTTLGKLCVNTGSGWQTITSA